MLPSDILFEGFSAEDWSIQDGTGMPGGDWNAASVTAFEILVNIFGHLPEPDRLRLVDTALEILGRSRTNG